MKTQFENLKIRQFENKKNNFQIITSSHFQILINLLKICVIILLISGCSLTNKTQDKKELSSNVGLKLWEQNCSRCHNSPSPASLSDAEWEVVGSHMRVRAYLSGKETDEIIKFLKTIN